MTYKVKKLNTFTNKYRGVKTPREYVFGNSATSKRSVGRSKGSAATQRLLDDAIIASAIVLPERVIPARCPHNITELIRYYRQASNAFFTQEEKGFREFETVQLLAELMFGGMANAEQGSIRTLQTVPLNIMLEAREIVASQSRSWSNPNYLTLAKKSLRRLEHIETHARIFGVRVLTDAKKKPYIMIYGKKFTYNNFLYTRTIQGRTIILIGTYGVTRGIDACHIVQAAVQNPTCAVELNLDLLTISLSREYPVFARMVSQASHYSGMFTTFDDAAINAVLNQTIFVDRLYHTVFIKYLFFQLTLLKKLATVRTQGQIEHYMVPNYAPSGINEGIEVTVVPTPDELIRANASAVVDVSHFLVACGAAYTSTKKEDRVFSGLVPSLVAAGSSRAIEHVQSAQFAPLRRLASNVTSHLLDRPGVSVEVLSEAVLDALRVPENERDVIRWGPPESLAALNLCPISLVIYHLRDWKTLQVEQVLVQRDRSVKLKFDARNLPKSIETMIANILGQSVYEYSRMIENVEKAQTERASKSASDQTQIAQMKIEIELLRQALRIISPDSLARIDRRLSQGTRRGAEDTNFENINRSARQRPRYSPVQTGISPSQSENE